MDIRAILMGVAFAAMWSSAFTSARIIVAEAPPIYALALRFLLSGAIAVGLAAWLGQSWRLTASQWRATLVFGICQNALYLGLNFVAMQTVEASLAAIIASTLPLLVALAGLLFFGERQRLMSVAGLVAGFAGVALIMGSRFGGGVDGFGILLCIGGVIALTVATLALRNASSGGNLLMVVGLQMLVGSAALWPFAILLEVPVVTISGPLIAAFAYTTLVPGLAATLVWFMLVGRVGAVRAAAFHFLNPFFGVAIAALLLGETFGILDAVGVTIIGLGILAVQLSRKSYANSSEKTHRRV
ncbi:DMT family transporter [Cognatishimia sp. F0-27]|uniref:DMT family transporter n=1 Tax=Cognatishimia sp. F0-27 TaxID=2816855 RepID=UPI001D0C431C|nr:DMT family transporter [Cognatishimia sp. F0-27]MCC1494679.1 DMT family transporter [Cognatishimia sp. F0-27]